MIVLYRYIKRKREEKENLVTTESSTPGAAPQTTASSKLSQKPPCRHQAPAVLQEQRHAEAQPAGLIGTEPPKQESDDSLKASWKPALNVDAKGKCLDCKTEKKDRRIYRLKIIVGLILPFALQALDVTIIASALPWIAADFHEVPQLNWIISAFNLTSAAFIPFWGQIADVFGRHNALQACVLIMMAGSALCTGAPTDAWPVLLLGRGFQGLGCAGINVIVRVIIADKVSLKENAKNWSIFAFTAGMSYGIGPVMGGYLTNTNWRWCFGINLPICLAAIILIFLLLRKELLGPQPQPQLDGRGDVGRLAKFSTRIMTIDAGGQLLFLSGFGLMILAFTWGGATYGWNTAQVLAPLCIGVVLAVAFIGWENLMAPGKALARRWPHRTAMLPWKLLVTKDIGLLFYVNFGTGAAMYSVLYFVSIYFTMVKMYTPSQAGVQLLYYTPGIGVGTYLSMFMCNVFPRRTFVPLFLGSLVECVGIAVLAWALFSEHTPTIYGMMAFTGAGTGLRLMPGSLHGVGFFPNHVATVISLMAVALPFGGTLALTIMSTVFNNTSRISKDASFTTLSSLPADVLRQVQHDAKMGIVWAFVAITPLMVFTVIAASFMGNVYITKDKKEEGLEHRLVHEPYILHMLRGKRGPDAGRDAEKSVRPSEAY